MTVAGKGTTYQGILQPTKFDGDDVALARDLIESCTTDFSGESEFEPCYREGNPNDYQSNYYGNLKEDFKAVRPLK